MSHDTNTGIICFTLKKAKTKETQRIRDNFNVIPQFKQSKVKINSIYKNIFFYFYKGLTYTDIAKGHRETLTDVLVYLPYSLQDTHF